MARRRRRESLLSRLARYFGQGLLIFVPLVATIYTLWLFLSWSDSLIGIPIPGVGLVVMLALILTLGAVATNVAGQAVITFFEGGIQHLPVVSLVYSSIKDLLGAFVGDKKSFDRPVVVALDEPGNVKVFGFVTCEHFDDMNLKDQVSVYLPQSYNFAGNLIVVPKDRVQRVDADPAQFMAFIVSGGVSSMGSARTVMDASTTIGTSTSDTSGSPYRPK